MNLDKHYDVIVVGGGHAGTEAALAASRMGAQTLLLTQNIDLLGHMSCNPAIGGIGKGHLVKEIDALGGVMAYASDVAGIQFRILNSSKGPAVRATRAQTDRVLYRKAIRQKLQSEPNLTIFQQAVEDLLIKGDKVTGVKTQLGLDFYASAVILTVGTFLDGKIHVGFKQSAGGRAGDAPSLGLAYSLRALNLPVGRLKTGTPPRVDKRSLDFSKMIPQPGDTPTPFFSYNESIKHPRQVPCHITHTTLETHKIITDNLNSSPMYTGIIEGVGPRYCPSIEDKVVRFAHKETHQIFVEPEGLTSNEIYPNGISTSLPFEVQARFVRTIKGFENAVITRPGYAIEYDYFDPRALTPYLQTKAYPNLFFAGQINGTTGYEEAAAQGLIAGINATLYGQEQELWSFKRNEAYIGVLVDDLVTLGTLEPYRMFTSRAEYRLLLREDNAHIRLTEKGYKLGLVSETQWQTFNEQIEQIACAQEKLKNTWVTHKHAFALQSILNNPLSHETKASDLLKRPEVSYKDLQEIAELELPVLKHKEALQVEIQSKYAGYIERQAEDIEKIKQLENTPIPSHLDYGKISGLSNEVSFKLKQIKPTTIAQAMRISGITPAAISLLIVHLKKERALS